MEIKTISCVDLVNILLGEQISKRKYVVADTTYYGQPSRITAIVHERFKYVYHKKDGFEELYDLMWDPTENYNILVETYYDKNRKSTVRYDELYFYPYKEEALKELNWFRNELKEFWIRASWLYEKYGVVRKKLSVLKKIFK